MLKKFGLLFGVVFSLVGILGFVPFVLTTDADGMKLLLGLFMVGVIHNLIHLASGVAALVLSKTNAGARLYFRVFGVVYAIVTVVGFAMKTTVLGLIHVNLADNFLHLVLAVALLALGFVFDKQLDTEAVA